MDLPKRVGDYNLIEFLGGGTFGKVYKAEHVFHHTFAAVKIFKEVPDIEDLLTEASAVFLKHPHIVEVVGFGAVSKEDKKHPYIAMVFAPKGTLRGCYPEGTRLSLFTIVTYVNQIASALQYAHERRWVHRDIKPPNILIGPNDEIWVGDFGISVVAHREGSFVVQRAAGTPEYMPYEQWIGCAVEASDQYALAIMVYEWLCGERPFYGNTVQLRRQHKEVLPPSLRSKDPKISSKVEQVVMRALAKKPEDRFPGVMEFARALEKTLGLPDEEYYPEHVARAMREFYNQWSDAANLGAPKEIGPEDARPQKSMRGTVGYERPFTNGSLYWSERGGTCPVWWGFAEVLRNMDGVKGKLGFPLTEELPAARSPQKTEGVFQRFEGRWDYPEDINTNPVRCGASLYYSDQYGSHPTWGGIGIRYERMGGTFSSFGFPKSSELEAGPSWHGTTGVYQCFEGGYIYWSWKTHAHLVYGDIGELYHNRGGAEGRLGFPLTDEGDATESPQKTKGRYQRFEGGEHDFWLVDGKWEPKYVTIYFSKHGTYPVLGGIGRCFEQLGGTDSELGFPTSVEMKAANSPQGTTGWYQYFEGGVIFWSDNYDSVPVTGSILVPYNEFGGTKGRFGFPMSSQTSVEGYPGMYQQEFEGGVICTMQAEPLVLSEETAYKIVSVLSGKTLDVSGGSQEDGVAIVQYEYHGGLNQQWELVPVEEGFFKIASRSSGKVLDVAERSQDSGADIVQNQYDGSASQHWQLVLIDDKNHNFKIASRINRKVLDVLEGRREDGTRIVQYDYHGGLNQLWRLVPIF